MKIRKKIALFFAVVMLVCLLPGCDSSTPEDENDVGDFGDFGDIADVIVDENFTLEDIARFNSYDVIFENYSAVFTNSTYFDLELPGRHSTTFLQKSAHVKDDDGVRLYVDFDFGEAYAIEGGNMYVLSEDNDYGIVAFFDDGYFEAFYLPFVSEWFAFFVEEGEELVSVTVAGDVRTVVTQIQASQMEDFDAWGIPDGIIEAVYELDAVSGIILREYNYLTSYTDGERRLLSQTEMQYGNAEDFVVPEYVLLSKDMTETRTVNFVRDSLTPEERVFTFTIPKNASVFPVTMEPYEYFTDAEGTVSYMGTFSDGISDELTFYMKKIQLDM